MTPHKSESWGCPDAALGSEAMTQNIKPTDKQMEKAREIAAKFCRSHNALMREQFAGGGCDTCFEMRTDIAQALADAAPKVTREAVLSAVRKACMNRGCDGKGFTYYLNGDPEQEVHSMKTRDKKLMEILSYLNQPGCRNADDLYNAYDTIIRWARSKAPRQDKHSLPGAWFNAGVNAYKDKFR